jgi:hypothetical protein
MREEPREQLVDCGHKTYLFLFGQVPVDFVLLRLASNLGGRVGGDPFVVDRDPEDKREGVIPSVTTSP